VHYLYRVKVGNDRSDYNKDKSGCSPGIEKQTGCQSHIVLVFYIGKIIEQKENRQKVKKKQAAAENHCSGIKCCL
jgi:hypothetical protein